MDDIKNAKWDRRYTSVLLLDGKEVCCFRQCCHCSRHFLSVRGSGITRGWCMRCNAITCGHPGCDPCVTIEQRLEIMEGTLDPNNIPVVVSVPRSIED